MICGEMREAILVRPRPRLSLSRRLRLFSSIGIAVASVFFAALSTASAEAGSFVVTDLGTLGGTTSRSYAINNSGAVVGEARTNNDTAVHGFLYRGGVMTDLGTLGGANSTAQAINDSGQITGFSDVVPTPNPDGFPTADVRAFRYSGGVMSDLGYPGSCPGGHENTFGFGINDMGDIAGGFRTCSGDLGVFLDSDGTMTPFAPSCCSQPQATDVNNTESVVGGPFVTADVLIQVLPTEGRAFVYRDGVATSLGTLGGGEASRASAVNDAGEIVGMSNILPGPLNRPIHAFLYRGGAMRDLGTLGGTNSRANGINGRGVVVGSSDTAGDSAIHAFVRNPNGPMRDLNDLSRRAGRDWVLETATGINDLGQIVGVGLINGREHAFLLSPPPLRPS